MAVNYTEALQILRKVAETRSQARRRPTERVPLLDAVGRSAAQHHVSPVTTPPKDTSAMDGYALSSAATVDASPENPVIFVVKGTIAAGDKPIELANELEDGALPCVEIMTGAQFPRSTSAMPFDACVKIEDTLCDGSSAPGSEFRSRKRIAVTRPLRPNANRRLAGGDMHEGDVILPKGTVVCSRHVMALASVGITEVAVYRKLRVAIWSTGNELKEGFDGACSDTQILNSNGPYLTTALKELGVDVDYNGILRDDANGLQSALSSFAEKAYDLVITTGAVSKGKFDFIVPALEESRASVHFHGVAIRPGHPVLFASTSRDTGTVPLFGLPGNPIATAACFRFLVVPFLKHFLGQTYEKAEVAKLQQLNGSQDAFLSSPRHLDCFRHGFTRGDGYGGKIVELSGNQSPAIISQFSASNCWVHIPRGRPVEPREAVVYCYPHKPSLV
ncbi:putative molybdenum cofactor biosynthesis protein [Decorospora gaudefroyi]|uniref:molybdopterin adenylyltransferase n=1 Tax=Decorospora gaudefroyi TaxID=184978 RepID=A0A6A5KQW8_9PLEO|nr:putative molybdenum cofactor biosynthesis protein [Decorospora gaudefroyi]